jgi:hypothetical protein
MQQAIDLLVGRRVLLLFTIWDLGVLKAEKLATQQAYKPFQHGHAQMLILSRFHGI